MESSYLSAGNPPGETWDNRCTQDEILQRAINFHRQDKAKA